MKHIQLFENWNKESIEDMIKSGVDSDFLQNITDNDFVENAIDLFKETGATSIKIANLVAAMEPNKSDLDVIINQTRETMNTARELVSTSKNDKSYNIFKPSDWKKIEDAISKEDEIISILNKIKQKQ